MIPLPAISPAMIKAALIVVAIAALTFGAYRHGVTTTRDHYEAAIQKQKADAAKVLLDETNKVRDLERRITLLNNLIGAEHERMEQERETARRDLERVARDRGGLRDPGRRGPSSDCPASGDRPATGARPGPAQGAELSPEASRFLHDLANEADAVVDQLLICQTYVTGLHAELRKRGAAR